MLPSRGCDAARGMAIPRGAVINLRGTVVSCRTANLTPCGRVLQLRGAYRRMMCKPQRLGCELLRFDKPREPLLPPPFGHADAVHGTHSVPDTAAPARKHLGAKLTFELPSGSYATSLLRELVADECTIRPGAS